MKEMDKQNPQAMGSGIIIRTALPGEASYVSYLHMKLYGQQYGFGGIFEYYVMRGMAEFLGDPTGSRLWVALDGNTIIGSIAIVRTDDRTAQLRWFMIQEANQGRGIGKGLMDAAMEFVGEKGYRRVSLWTIGMLEAARHLYERYGFVRQEEKPNTQWTGRELTEERWELAL